MTVLSTTHRILRTALALAVLMQTAFAAPIGGCGMSGGCCAESSGSLDSGSCCCTPAGKLGSSCCRSDEADDSAIATDSCCNSAAPSVHWGTCSCGLPKPVPTVPPTDGDTQIRLIPVYDYLAAAADPASANSVSTGRIVCQSSLLQTAPRSAQVLFCTWLT